MKTEIEFNLPDFPGFYNTILSDYIDESSISDDENHGLISPSDYESINWNRTFDKIAQKYLACFIDENDLELEKFGIELTFVKVDSPQYYNFSTDKLVCKASFNKDELIIKLEDEGLLTPLVLSGFMGQFTSYSGFCSFYTNDPFEWIDLINEKLDTDNVVFELVIQLITRDCDNDLIANRTVDNYFELLEYNN